MMKVLKILIPFFLVSWTNVFSQQLSHQVLVPLAGITSDNKISYSQTVGETAVEIVECSPYIFTQGFQQPGIKLSHEDPPPGTGVNVYPNPATDYITIELFGESARTFRIDIINITGTVVLTERKVFDGQFWYKEPQNIENLIRGFYLIRISSEDGILNRAFKIEKI
jgi:hypothetical protein